MSNVDWLKAHTQKKQRDITGSLPEKVLEYHKLPPDVIKEGMVVLDIGLGYGNMARFIRDKGAIPYCIDVIPEAFHGVLDTAEKMILTKDLKNTEPINADFGLCHLVVQHCDDAELRELLTGILLHIKEGGIISIQVAERDTCGRNRFLRNKKEFKRAVKQCGGDCVNLGVEYKWPKYGSKWFISRISRP